MNKFLFFLSFLLPSLSLSAQEPKTIDQQLDDIIAEMSIEEKIYQLTSNTFFTTGDNSRLGIPGFVMSDGPHGVRFGGATAFPTGIAQAATWDVDFIEEMSKAMAEEFWAKGKHQQLGPCLDLCRDPRNGRSPETLGEDPYLAAKIGTAIVKGIQQTPVVATAKHFNLVNKQQYRHNSHTTISERMLMEHYGLSFKNVVQEAGVLSVMNAYNLINNVYCSESPYLLQTILRERWGFPFYVVSDWGAVHNTEKAIEAGTDICMGSEHYQNDLQPLLNSGAISMANIDNAVRNVLRTKFLSGMLGNYPRPSEAAAQTEAHEAIALEAGRKALVLLKNEDNILPLDPNSITKIALIGPSANKAQLDGFGSSWVEPNYTVSPREGIANIIGASKITYAKGCDINSTSEAGFAAAKEAAANADVVIFVGGLDDTQEGEGYGDRPEYDRKGGSIDLPGKQQKLINELAAVNEKVIVVLKSGGICGINESIDNMKGLMYAFYPGQEGGNAIAEALFGAYNPGGKLPVTYPKNDEQLPVWNDDFDDDFGCGYRWFDQFSTVPEFAFGFGLSYTDFTYSNLQLSATNIEAGKSIEVSVDVTNSGEVAGDEVAQMYLTDKEASVWMPKKQLKGFERIVLEAGETKTVIFRLAAEDFYFWNETTKNYEIEAGNFTAKVGGSSDNLLLQADFEITEAAPKPDLSISKVLTSPRFPLVGDEVRFLAMVKNEGTKAFEAGQATQIDFAIEGQVVASTNLSALSIPVGGMKMVEVAADFWTAEESGLVEVTATIDGSNTVEETLEGNNQIVQTFEVYDESDSGFQPNIALLKPVYASSSESNELTPPNAVDGSYNTRWASLFSDPQYLIVSLQNLYELNNITLHWEAAFSTKYSLSVSTDSTNWTKVIDISNGNGGLDSHDLANVTAKYIRFDGLTRGTIYGHSFYELEAFGKLVDETTDIEGLDYAPIRFFPNPAKGVLNVAGLDASTAYELQLYSTDGKLVLQKKMEGDSAVDISGLEAGQYVAELKGGGLTVVKKVVKF
ncbi:MAG: glycoside hydrolase family 3 C-terminal domain-containing protein [Chitinophagales bacterium]